MILDTSVVVAILFGEPESEFFEKAIEENPRPKMSAASYLEAAIVIDGTRNPIVSRRFDELLAEAEVQIVPFTASQAKIARDAYRDFGKGTGHPAHLNYGDCFSYALAKESGEPLLYKGDDFGHTDLHRPSTR